MRNFQLRNRSRKSLNRSSTPFLRILRITSDLQRRCQDSAAATGAHDRSAPAPPFPVPLAPHSQSAISAANFVGTTNSWAKSPWIMRSPSRYRSAQHALARVDRLDACTCTRHFSGGPTLYGRALTRILSTSTCWSVVHVLCATYVLQVTGPAHVSQRAAVLPCISCVNL